MRLWVAFGLLLAAGPSMAAPWQGFTSLAISPDGTSLAVGEREGEVLWLDAASGEVRGRWPGQGLPVVTLAFALDGQSLAAANLGESFELLSPGNPSRPLPSDHPLAPKVAHARERWLAVSVLVSGTAVTGKKLWARGSADGTLSVGRLGETQPLITWHGHDAGVTGLVFSSDDADLISAAYDGTLVRWDPLTGVARGRL